MFYTYFIHMTSGYKKATFTVQYHFYYYYYFLKQVGVCPLVDNRNEDYYLYQITVSTGNRLHAGTKSNIFFNLSGIILIFNSKFLVLKLFFSTVST